MLPITDRNNKLLLNLKYDKCTSKKELGQFCEQFVYEIPYKKL
ncbi:hypothetical protein CFOL_v3_13674 [Cephalotus follicularis]|uniref:Uncharacterized protein n=1 Tax=Cephalotus follicularis TaxID=3775 RepID=A0A1Q3BQ59_CEPFO|nr:hypothetical protein CFOL_v3_13674 [Cephalotus follicularis]